MKKERIMKGTKKIKFLSKSFWKKLARFMPFTLSFD
jgi:hypothetical protein